MNPWIILTIVMAGIVFAVDFFFRRKKWKDQTKKEKISLLINMFSVGPYAFLSVLGMLWGIVPGSPETPLGEVVYDATLMMGSVYFVIALGAVMASLILRKKEKTNASIWVNAAALAYIAAVFAVNTLAGNLL